MIGGAGYWVLSSVEHGVDEKIKLAADATSAKLDAEKLRREEFQTLATKTHLDTVKKLDEIVADLRSQFNTLSVRYLEGQHLEAFYRSQCVKAQEVLDREGVTSSSEVHIQLIPKINKLQAQIDVLTEEITALRLTNKNTGATGIVNERKDPASTEGSDVKNFLSAETERDQKVGVSTGIPKESSDMKNSGAAATAHEQKDAASTEGSDTKSTKSEVSEVEGRGGPRSPN